MPLLSTLQRMIFTSTVGRSLASVATDPMRFTTGIPPQTRPKMVCFPSSQGVGASVMKNCRVVHQIHVSAESQHLPISQLSLT